MTPTAQRLTSNLQELLPNIWTRFSDFVRRHTIALIASALIVLAAMTLWSQYRDWMTHDIALLSGPSGGAGVDDSIRIVRQVESESNSFSARYQVHVEPTEGFEAARKAINDDVSGKVIGFAHDGFNNTDNIRLLLPLDKNFLHILCWRKFLTEVAITTESQTSTGGVEPVSAGTAGGNSGKKVVFSQIAAKLRPGRVYSGGRTSGTRQMADLVAAHYGIELGKLQAPGIANWHDMRAAFNNGSIDLAFMNTRMDEQIIKDIAKDGNCILVGLDGSHEAIAQGRVYVFPEEFAANSYSNGDFCPEIIQTIASRRVLICSKYMPERTAFFLAEQAHTAMRRVIPEIDWETPPPGQTERTKLTYELHPGTKRLKDEKPPGLMPWNTTYLFWTLGLWMTAEFLQWVNKRVRPESVEKAKAAEKARLRYLELKSEIDDNLHKLERAPLPLSEEDRKNWSQMVLDLRQRIIKDVASQCLTEQDSEVLFEGIRELEHELRAHSQPTAVPVAAPPPAPAAPRAEVQNG
jgi:NMT1-like family